MFFILSGGSNRRTDQPGRKCHLSGEIAVRPPEYSSSRRNSHPTDGI